MGGSRVCRNKTVDDLGLKFGNNKLVKSVPTLEINYAYMYSVSVNNTGATGHKTLTIISYAVLRMAVLESLGQFWGTLGHIDLKRASKIFCQCYQSHRP